MSKCGACGYVSMSLDNKHTVYKVLSVDGTFYRCSVCLNVPFGAELDISESNMSKNVHMIGAEKDTSTFKTKPTK